jgi:hypothetical protein
MTSRREGSNTLRATELHYPPTADCVVVVDLEKARDAATESLDSGGGGRGISGGPAGFQDNAATSEQPIR